MISNESRYIHGCMCAMLVLLSTKSNRIGVVVEICLSVRLMYSLYPKFHVARLYVRRVERVETSVSSRDAPSGIWAYTVMLNGSIISDCSTSLGRQVANNVLLYIGSHSGADWVTGSVGRTHLPPSIPVTRLVIRSRREARSEVPAAHERKKTRCFYIE